MLSTDPWNRSITA